MWAEWFVDDLPCVFSRERTRENASFLTTTLSTEFTTSAGRARSSHPLLNLWDNSGPTSLLRLNSLAEDLRLLTEKRNVDTVIADLKDIGACPSAWHTLHAAALLERARPGTVIEFVRAKNDTVPDFIIKAAAASRLPVEAKLLTRSELEDAFHGQAEAITRAISTHLAGRAEGIGVVVVIKETVKKSVVSEVLAKVMQLSNQWNGSQLDFRSDEFNVRIERPALASGMAEHRLIHILAPVPFDEVLRVKSRARQASSQLRSLPNAERSGLLALGLSDRHDGSLVFTALERGMKAGRYRGIAATLLLKSGVHLGPPQRTTVDLAEIRFNSFAAVPADSDIQLRSVGPMLTLTKVEPAQLDVPAYRHLLASGKPIGSGSGYLGLNDIPRVPTALLD